MKKSHTITEASGVCSLTRCKPTLQVLLVLCLFCTNASASTISWYDSNSIYKEGTCREKLCYTASGKEIHKLEKAGVAFCAASKAYRMGSRLKVTNLDNGKNVEVVVVDRGGFHKYDRVLDLSKASFKKLADPKVGILKNIKVEVLKCA